MPEDHRTNPPAPDPATDIFLCRAPLASNGPAMPEGNCTRLFAHPVAGCTPLFYLSFRLDPAGLPLVRRFDSPADAAAYILGMAGPQLAGIPGPEQDRIRTYFPGWFEGPGPDNGSPPAGAGMKPAGPVGEGDREEEGRELPGILERDRVGTGNNFPAGAGNRSNTEFPEQDQQRIREYFPGGFGNRDADKSDPQKITPFSPVQGCDTGQHAARRPEIPTDPHAGVQPRNNPQSPGPGPGAARDPAPPGGNTGPDESSLPAAPGEHHNSGSRDSQFPLHDTAGCTPADIANLYSPTPAPDPANCAILYRSLRYSLRDGALIENGTDLLATRDPACFWLRHWTWDGGKWTDRCEFGTRNEAVGFIREQFTKPGLFSSWNHRGIREFLPEVYGKE